MSLKSSVPVFTFVEALGGAVGVEISWPEICWLAERFNDGQQELLLADGRVNTFFMRDGINSLHEVRIYLTEKGQKTEDWAINFSPVYFPCKCHSRSRVFFLAPRVEPEVGNQVVE